MGVKKAPYACKTEQNVRYLTINQSAIMPNIRSTSYPERPARNFNEWQDDLQWERDLDRLLEDFKRSIGQRIRTAYYATKETPKTEAE